MEIIKKEIDFNNSIFEILVLCALTNKDSRVYEIHKTLLEHSDNRINISTNTIYNILNKLLDKKLVSEHNVQQKAQDAYYQLTAFGEAHLNRLLHYFYVNQTVINQTIYQLTKNQNKTPFSVL